MIPYINDTTGRRDYHPAVSRHHLNPPRDRRRWPMVALILGAWLGLIGLMLLGAFTR